MGFNNSLYNNEDVTWLFIFIDDILLLGNKNIITKLMYKFKINDLGEVRNYLGLEITKEVDKMIIKPTEMIEGILKRFNMENSKKIETPM